MDNMFFKKHISSTTKKLREKKAGTIADKESQELHMGGLTFTYKHTPLLDFSLPLALCFLTSAPPIFLSFLFFLVPINTFLFKMSKYIHYHLILNFVEKKNKIQN